MCGVQEILYTLWGLGMRPFRAIDRIGWNPKDQG